MYLEEEQILEALKSVYDPELNMNIVDLGLIYGIGISDENDVSITMTLTTPGCPLHSSIQSGVEHCLEGIEGIGKIDVNLVWEPAWSPDKMTEEGRRYLGMGR